MTHSQAKYKTFAEVAAAFNSGELFSEEWVMEVDKAEIFLCWVGDNPYDEDDIGDHTDRGRMIGRCRRRERSYKRR